MTYCAFKLFVLLHFLWFLLANAEFTKRPFGSIANVTSIFQTFYLMYLWTKIPSDYNPPIRRVWKLFSLYPQFLKEEEICFGVRYVSDKGSPVSARGRKQFSDHKAVDAAKSQTPVLAPLIEVPHYRHIGSQSIQSSASRIFCTSNTALHVKLLKLSTGFMLFNRWNHVLVQTCSLNIKTSTQMQVRKLILDCCSLPSPCAPQWELFALLSVFDFWGLKCSPNHQNAKLFKIHLKQLHKPYHKPYPLQAYLTLVNKIIVG